MSLQRYRAKGCFVGVLIVLFLTCLGLASLAAAADQGATRSDPVVTLVAPEDNAILNEAGVVTFECDATDDTGLKSVTLYHDIGQAFGPAVTEYLPVGEYPDMPEMELWMHLDEPASPILDSSGYGRDGTVNAAVYLPLGFINGAYSFNGVSQNIQLPSSNYGFPGKTGASMAAWVRPAAGQSALSGSIIFIDRAGTTQTRMLISVNNDRTISVKGRSNAEGFQVATTDLVDAIPLGVWTHIVGVLDLSTPTGFGSGIIYINGEHKKTQTLAFTQGTFAVSTATNPGIGAISGTPTTYSFKGDIDEVAVFNRVLTLEEVQALYNGLSYPSWSASFDVPVSEAGTYTWNCEAKDVEDNAAQAANDFTLIVALCGNGQVDVGEQCDDGGTASGDCCSSTCLYEAAGSDCPDDGESCTLDLCDASGICTHPYDPALPDGDADGVPNECDNCPVTGNANQADVDSDGVGNVCDNCLMVYNPRVTCPGPYPCCDIDPGQLWQVNTDCDGFGDECDNCPTEPNNGQQDSDDDGIGDACECYTAGAPSPDPTVPDVGFGTRVRYLAFSAGTAGRLEGIRVTFTDLPPPFEYAEGRTMWVGLPRKVSEVAGKSDDTAPTFYLAELQCESFFTDWSQKGTVYLRNEGLVPYGEYELQAIGKYCPPEGFSGALSIALSQWGDSVGTTYDEPPDSLVNFVDIPALVDKFKNTAGAPTKSRMDLAPSLPDMIVDFTDITWVVDAFQGRPYPFAGPPALNPCD